MTLPAVWEVSNVALVPFEKPTGLQVEDAEVGVLSMGSKPIV